MVNTENNYICQSCNNVFDEVEKTNKFLKICGLIAIYGCILYVVESLPTNDLSLILPRFILDVAFFIIMIVHIIITLAKSTGRGKCPVCGATDFVMCNSVKGQQLLKEIKKLKRAANNQEAE